MKTRALVSQASVVAAVLFAIVCSASLKSYGEVSSDYAVTPPFITAAAPPLVMLVMGRDHKLYYEAYNDASDLDGDGSLDVGYKPTIDYYGYFDSYACYEYSTTNTRFEPVAATTDKTCTNLWSGDFLNYLTMSRMDTMRKVLYGGYRSTDTSTTTVLERSFIPQDAHSWGKEYESIARDGFDIRDYAPLPLPVEGTRHLLANTTLSNTGQPLLRVLNDSRFRIWEWVARERPVAGDYCALGTTSCTYAAQILRAGHPTTTAAFQTLLDTWGVPDQLCGSGPIPAGNINTSGSNNNPFAASPGCGNEYYLTVIRGQIYTATAGTYQFSTNGDDAVELRVDGNVVSYWYGGHGAKTGTAQQIADAVALEGNATNGTVSLTAGWHDFEFRHEELTGGDNYQLLWKPPAGAWEIVPAGSLRLDSAASTPVITTYSLERQIPASSMTDYTVRVKVPTDASCGLNCRPYGETTTVYKPAGMLQKHGENDDMYFGLMTGSYTENTSGGVLRKNISSIKDEIDPDTGVLTSVNGIISTINKLRIADFRYPGSGNYDYSGGLEVGKPMPESTKKFPDWGNPVAEMMYESMRYFANESPTAEYDYIGTTVDANLGLPKVAWEEPFTQICDGETKDLYCSKPIMLVISDINPSYDSDQLPGSAFAATGWNSGVTLGADTLNVQSRLDAISSEVSGLFFIGEDGSFSDKACTPKTISGLGDVRGLCPEEPTKQGGYYAGALSHYGANTDLRPDLEGQQKTATYSVALSSPLPEIKIPVNGDWVTMVPFGKSVVYGGLNPAEGAFQPTLTIVDFFVEELADDRSFGKFRINFEDVEQGNDHDMDTIVLYEYWVQSDNTIKIKLTKEYQAAGIVMHMGYIISGTTKDGIYLEVASKPTGDIAYFLDTPPDRDEPGRGTSTTLLSAGVAGDNTAYSRERVFTPGTVGAASILKDPLWYAAKWGGTEEDRPWDADGDGVPDTYYFVANPSKLEKQLTKAFTDILNQTSSGTAASVISNSRSGEGAIYQSIFYPELQIGEDTIAWAGELHAFFVDEQGNMREDTNQNQILDDADLVIRFEGSDIFKYAVDDDGFIDLTTKTGPFSIGSLSNATSIKYLWKATDWLNSQSLLPTDQRAYGTADATKRYIFTFADTNANGIVDSGEQIPFTAASRSALYPYVTLYPSFEDKPQWVDNIGAWNSTMGSLFRQAQTDRVINYIRGQDQGEVIFNSVAVPAMRPREYIDPNDGFTKTWRLGDIVHSSPTVVGRPAEGYHLLYRDTSYAEFLAQYQNRRSVVYTGANDGMIHAFNAGFFDTATHKFQTSLAEPFVDLNGNNQWDAGEPFVDRNSNGVFDAATQTPYELGSELWAYVPYNLLPHLYWLTEEEYPHVYFNDLTPKVFDAKIFPPDDDHPQGWGTVMVVGMRLGGGEIRADANKDDIFDPDDDRKMSSAFVVFDITNPEVEPRVLAEVSLPGIGYTTCYPAVIPMRSSTGVGQARRFATNDWYLVFGSGPADSSGVPTSKRSGDNVLEESLSLQEGKLFVLDLKKLAQEVNPVISTLDHDGLPTTTAPFFMESFEANSYISQPITVDFNLDFNADTVYFGTIAGPHLDTSDGTYYWDGKMRRLLVNNEAADISGNVNWTGTAYGIDRADNYLIDLSFDSTTFFKGQPISAAASVTLGNRIIRDGVPVDVNGDGFINDFDRDRWLFFGTGRYMVTTDNQNLDQQSFYGIKEPVTMDGTEYRFRAESVKRNELIDVSTARIYGRDSATNTSLVTGVTGVANWEELATRIDLYKGWFQDFEEPGEKNLGQATLLGDLLSFTTYVPDEDICSFGGESYLSVLYYLTGTAYFESTIGDDWNDANNDGIIDVGEQLMLNKLQLGRGLALTPNIHTGRQEGSKVFIQTSTGAIEAVQELNPGLTKSGKTSWRQR